VNLNQGVVRITGKGGRERLIPLSSSVTWVSPPPKLKMP